jgi:alpha-L-glutamate ligase-like protein
MSLSKLRERGILGINRRNAAYTLGRNPRDRYPLVDDKLATKRMCRDAKIPVPELLGVARTHREAQRLVDRVRDLPSFVVKPARGAMGNGILVLEWRDGVLFRGRRPFAEADLVYHAAGIVSGLYSLAGHMDVAMVEERLVIDPAFEALVEDGVPDVRIIVYRGVPVMAMMRLPTQESDARANLHQGAVGAGVDVATGRVLRAIQHDRRIERSPDTGAELEGFEVPHFRSIVDCAIRATAPTGLEYVGADVVVDATKGPVILELNARPGLAIQLANGAGLRPRLDATDAWFDAQPGETPRIVQRAAFGRSLAEEMRS